MMNYIAFDFRKVLKKGVLDFSKFDHSMFDFDSLKRLLFILSKRKADVYLVHFPGDHDSFNQFILFWVNNCYPGTICGCIKEVGDLTYYDEDHDVEPIVKKDDHLFPIISYGEVTPISEDDMRLAFHYLKP